MTTNRKNSESTRCRRMSSSVPGNTIAVAGVLGGACIALGLPLIVLVYGQSLGSTLLTIFVITALLIGDGGPCLGRSGPVIPSSEWAGTSLGRTMAENGPAGICRRAIGNIVPRRWKRWAEDKWGEPR